MKIGIIGYGVVGQAIEQTFSKKHEIIAYDKYKESCDFEELLETEFIFISVPTPFDFSNYRVDDSSVVESLDNLAKENYEGIVIVKSTLPPGSCDSYSNNYDLKIVFNPEFLRESTTPNEDFENQDTIVIGTQDKMIFDKVKLLYDTVVLHTAKYYMVSYVESEMIKYSQNTMLASRVAIANIIYDACEELGISYDTIKKIAFDRFEILGPHMTLVPGPDGKRGFGGKCLPKDIHGFTTVHDSELLYKIIEYNSKLRDDLGSSLLNYET